jgi:hypothetical protein
MREESLKENLRILAEQAVQRIATDERPLEYFAGKHANLDTERDAVIEALPAYEDARRALGSISMISERYGGETPWGLLALDFVYGFLGNLSEPNFDLRTFESTWEEFWEELSEPEWTYLGLANLLNFRSESMMLDLGDGITIRRRSVEKLAGMGWSEYRLEQLAREWFEGGGSSSYIILTEHKLPKVPENFLLSDMTGYMKAERALRALRLLKEGDIRIGRMWFLRPASFDLGAGGSLGAGSPPSGIPGSQYTLDEHELPAVRDLYSKLVRYEEADERPPVNLGLAFRSFSDVYERRDQHRTDTRLLDAITAAEALLGTSDEATFRLAFRVAMLLGSDDDERVHIFERMKGYYRTRSSVVHGGSRLYNRSGRLKRTPRWHLENQQDLRDFVRRLLVGFLHLSLALEHQFNSDFFENRLDSTLLHNEKRSELRAAMALEESDSHDSP